MKILALEHEKPALTAKDFAPYLKVEAARAWEFYQKGIFRELYFDRDQHTAVLVLECSSLEEAKTCLDQLPMVQAGLIEFELHALVPYDGFSRLFS